MAIVHGQIESLRRIKDTLERHGIERFNSIADINDFVKNYESEIEELKWEIEEELADELGELETKKKDLEEAFHILEEEAVNDYNSRYKKLEQEVEEAEEWEVYNFIFSFFKWVRLTYYKNLRHRLKNKRESIIGEKTGHVANQIDTIESRINHLTANKEKIIHDRYRPKVERVAEIRAIAVEINPLIAGAIGESKVKKEIQKLSDDHILFNDFSVKFDTPIYNRKKKDKIFSIQIDHLLINQAGVFILETKNWSKKSVENLDLRSPVEQIRRTSYALFVLLNSTDNSELGLKQHHWGKKQVPIRNVIVMINAKPRETFKYVKVKGLWELNSYVQYFDPVFDKAEVSKVAEYLKEIKEDESVMGQPMKTINEVSRARAKRSSKKSLSAWLKDNPGKGINDYYLERRKS